MKKTFSRVAATQIIYNFEINKKLKNYSELAENDLIKIIDDNLVFTKDSLDNKPLSKTFAKNIVLGVINFQDKIDEDITNNLNKNWSFKNLSPLFKAVLRCAVFEVISDKENKYPLIISEYLKISDEYFNEEETKFINACVDSIKEKYKKV